MYRVYRAQKLGSVFVLWTNWAKSAQWRESQFDDITKLIWFRFSCIFNRTSIQRTQTVRWYLFHSQFFHCVHAFESIRILVSTFSLRYWSRASEFKWATYSQLKKTIGSIFIKKNEGEYSVDEDNLRNARKDPKMCTLIYAMHTILPESGRIPWNRSLCACLFYG